MPKVSKLNGWIGVDWPSEMPRTIEDVANDVGWQVRRREGEVEICLSEHLEMKPVTPLRFIRVGERSPTGEFRLGRMTSWVDQDVATSWRETVGQVVAQRQDAAELAVRLSALRLLVSVSAPSQLPGLVNCYLRDHVPEMNSGSAWIVETDRRLFHTQMAVARSLFRSEELPEVIRAAKSDASALSGGMGLQPSDSLGGGSMFQPVFAALTPVHFGSLATHASGSLLMVFGEPLIDPPDGLPRTLPDLHSPSGIGSPRLALGQVNDTSAVDAEQLFVWWTQRWNHVLGQLVDPAIHYWPPNTRFSPPLMIGRFLSLLRLLACVQETLIRTSSDEFIRLMMLFDSLDLLRGFKCNMGDYSQMADPAAAERELIKIETALKDLPGVARVVLPRCRSGVKALCDLRSGFASKGQGESVNSEVRRLVQSLRNARHGVDKFAKSIDGMKVLMSHPIDISPNLADLAWFQLIRMMCFVEWKRAGS